MNTSRSSLLASVAALAFLTTADRLSAQIPIGGIQTGTLAAGVYHATSNLTVPTGQTLTLNPGVIIKFTAAYEVTVYGTLIANGTALNPVIFSDDADDTAGGNTNGGGVSVGVPASWRGIVFASTAGASSLSHADVRYGGSSYVANIVLNSCSPTLANCVIRNNYLHGMDLNGNSFPTVTNCTFTNNAGTAVEGVPLAAVPGFTNNTASGNAANYLRVTVGTVDANLTIASASQINNALMVATNITVATGATLTLAEGVIIKFTAAYEFTVYGTLAMNGTAANPVIVTDDADDSAGGDTNNNGASSGVSAAWRGIVFAPTAGASSLSHADVRYGGSSYVANIVLNTCSPTLANCVIRNNYLHGMDLNGNSFPTVSNCTFTNNSGNAVEAVPLAAVPGFTNNTASGNAGNYLRVTVGAIASNLAIASASQINNALMVATNITVAAGATLTLAEGVIVKFTAASQFTVNGTLAMNGTAANPVIVTDDADDSAGGDTNNNGPSSGVPAAWRGIVFASTAGASSLSHADVRYGGSSYVSNIVLNTCNATLANCVIRNNLLHGMDLNSNSLPTVSNCTFTNNGGNAVEAVPLAAVPGFTNNAASGNAGNYLRVTTASVTSALTVGPQSILNGALMMATNLTVQAGAVLTVEQGIAFKFIAAYEVIVDGAVDLRGTTYEPIVFTDDADDSVAGDTNNNGPSIGAPAAWRGFTIHAAALASRLENVVIRYTGSSYVPGLTSSSPNVILRSVRVDDAFDRGFELGALAGNPTNLVAWSCGGFGVHLTGGAFDLVHATCAANSTGIRRETAYAGRVVNSNCFANSTNFSNFVAAQVQNSNGGFTGLNGNLSIDPQFDNVAGGDLHLGAASPCLGAADFYTALAVVKDHDENSRILDHALVGFPAPDMGAFERPAWGMTVTGVARPGSTVTFTVTGPPGDSFIGIGLLDGAVPILPFGMLLAGANPGITVALLYPLSIPVGFPIPLPLANSPYLLGIAVGIQTLTLPTGNLSVGNFTRLHRMLIRP